MSFLNRLSVIRVILVCCLMSASIGASAQYWGAVYIDMHTGIAGGSYDAKTRRLAENTALESCNDKHKGRSNNCKLVTSFANGCIAVYWAPNKLGGYGTHGFNMTNAKARGSKACADEGGRGCRNVLSFCTTIPTYY